MNAITPAAVLRRRPDVRYRRIEGEAVVLRQSTSEVLVLNEVGASVLDLADGERSVGDWIETLAGEYAADRETHEKMGFHEGWGQCADQLTELVKRI